MADPASEPGTPPKPGAARRPVRSYVRREGRITRAQARALAELWPRYGIEPGAAPLDFEALFGRRAPVVAEIGFGSGDALVEMAAEHPDSDYLGIEVWRPGVGRLLLQLAERGITNVRVVCADAAELFARSIEPGTLAAVLVFFPDPWPKKRHHKRRLIQPAFAAQLVRSLEPGGRLHVATDWEDYAHHIMAVLSAQPGIENTAGAEHFAARPAYRPPTRYEARGAALGHRVYDIVFAKQGDEATRR